MAKDEKALLQECELEWYSGSGAGGQHRNKHMNCLRLHHGPSGITVSASGRHRHVNQREALKELRRRLTAASDAVDAAKKKAKRDLAVRDHRVVRTYDMTSGVVKDHRSGRKSTIRKILKGDIGEFLL